MVSMDTADNTLDDLHTESFSILVFCDGCGRQVILDRRKLPEGVTIQEPNRRLRCSGCGSRECSVSIVYTGAGGYSMKHTLDESRA